MGDGFKNLMMVKGYQVYTPVEDIWGSDFLISKNGKDFERIQVKSTTNWKDIFSFVNHADKIYQNRSLITIISIMDDTPVENLPDKQLPKEITGKSLESLHNEFKQQGLCSSEYLQLMTLQVMLFSM